MADPVALDGGRFWKGGKYDIQALDEVYTGAHALAHQRVDAILSSLIQMVWRLTHAMPAEMLEENRRGA